MTPHQLLEIQSPDDFVEKVLQTFYHQARNNKVYQEFIWRLGINISTINRVEQIPFLPISFFKSHQVINQNLAVQKVFTSSGTQGIQSQHHVADVSLYQAQLSKSFQYFYGDFSQYHVLPLLPSYAEREGSSLIEMVDFWMKNTQQSTTDYYLYNHQKLHADLKQNHGQKHLLLIGVSFALLDFAAHFADDSLPPFTIIETGGMKGKRKEITRETLHQTLQNAFPTAKIHSEYGMTELLSQAYLQQNGKFKCPPWMQILIRDAEDPLSFLGNKQTGGINVIDLANWHSCSFIATDDLGRTHENNTFEVLGRFDHSDIRGCNLLVLE